MYKLLPIDIQTNKPAQCVIRTTDGACIPFNEANTDYQAYLKHIAEGGVVLPADDNEQAA